MKKKSSIVWSTLLVVTAIGLGIFAENQFSIINKIKKYVSSCKASCNTVQKNRVAVDEFNIIISESAMKELRTQRTKALDGNKKFSYVDAKLIHKKDTIYINLKLKGDRHIHFNDDRKWSFRVKTKDEKKIYKVKRFSLHRAGARNYIHEWIFHKALEKIDLIGLKYEFIRLKLGDEDLGIYAFEEHFENSLIANQGFTLGPILRFNEDYSLTDFQTTYVEAFQNNYWIKKNPQMLQRAISNLEKWRRGTLKTSEVFNAEKLAKYFALTDVLWMPHAQVWKSIRFYYNPNSELLEPIGYDAHHNEYFFKNKMTDEVSASIPLHYFVKDVWVDLYKDWYDMLFTKPETFDIDFYTNYMGYLKFYSNKDWLDHFFSNQDREIEKELAVIYSDPNSFKDDIFSFGNKKFKFTKNAYYERAKHIRNTFKKTESIHAYPFDKDKQGITLEIENIGHYAVIIDRFYQGDWASPVNQVLIPHASNTSPKFELYKVPYPHFVDQEQDLLVEYHIIGEQTPRSTKVFSWKRKLKAVKAH